MKFSGFITLVLPTLAFAAPTNETRIFVEPGKYGVYHEGQYLTVNETEMLELLKAQNILPSPPPIDEDWLKWTPPANETKPALAARGQCDSTISFITDKTQRFTDWDVQMSAVLIGGRHGADMSVEDGFSVSNTVGVSAGLNPTFIKDVLGGSVGINYSKTWLTSASTRWTTRVPRGEVGCWTYQPWVNRRYGRVFRGCPGGLTQTGTFMADAHEDSSQNLRNWVNGYIFPCIKKERDLTSQGMTRCHGSGLFR